MSTTLTIPTTTLTVGTHTFGPATVNTTSASLLITIDPTVTNGLDTVTSAVIDIALEYSTDGGTTWQFLAGATGVQGPITNRFGQSENWTQSVSLPGFAFQARGSITVHTASVAIGGSLTVN